MIVTPIQCLKQIRDYTREHSELQNAHHFLFDLRIGSGPVEVITIGLNPHEDARQLVDHPADKLVEGSIYEESSEVDFMHPHVRPWNRQIQYFCGTDQVAQTELFFWSSADIGAGFEAHFGTKFARSTHLQFCCNMNLALIEHHKPKLIVAPGFAVLPIAEKLYGLERVKPALLSDKGHRLIEHFRGQSVDWIFTKHWTGAFGFSRTERELVRDYVAEHRSERSAA